MLAEYRTNLSRVRDTLDLPVVVAAINASLGASNDEVLVFCRRWSMPFIEVLRPVNFIT